MTFLPIVERELRVAARKQSTFWLRVSAALVGLVIGAGLMILSRLGPLGASTMGDALFGTLTWLALLVALSAGLFFTADCLSEEKREGTLGFLFLTDLRGYDVVGGKLLATSLRVTYGLLAVMPILAVTFLMGAVSGAHYWKTALALLNALFYSLAAGLMVSALSRDSQKALAATVLLLLLLVLGGLAADGIYSGVKHRAFKPLLSLASPGYVFGTAGAWGRNRYWLALGLNQVIGWTMLALACLVVPHSWQEKRRRPKVSRLGYWWKYGGARRRRALRRKLLERDPVLWLACRERWQSDAIWVLALLVVGLVVGFVVGKASDQVWNSWGSLFWVAVGLLYLWIASQAGRFYIEARHSGFLELLLVAPPTVKEVVRGHWRALLRMFGVPVALLLLAELAGGCLAYGATWGKAGPQEWRHLLAFITAAASTLATLASLLALAWFGMWMGMTSRTASLATLKTLLFVKVIPFLVIYFVAMYVTFLVVILPQILNPTSGSTTVTAGSMVLTPAMLPLLMTCLPAALSVAASLAFLAWARHRLYSAFRQQAARDLGQARLGPAPVSAPPSPLPPRPAAPPPGGK